MEKQTLLTLHRSVFSSLFFASTLLLLCIFSCQTAEEKSKKPIMQFSQFVNEVPLEITITTNLEALFEKKDDPIENEKEIFQKANCKILKNGETFFKGKIKIKKRGVTRKKICAIPPVMIKFGKNEKSFKIKLVTPCLKNKDAQQLVYKEYLTYQIYRNLTPHSFKTQLVNITYKDKKDRILDIEATGFLIEEVNEAAERMTAKLLQRHDKIRYLNQDSYRLFAMFQYCIGNTDWNLKLHHNIRMIQKLIQQVRFPFLTILIMRVWWMLLTLCPIQGCPSTMYGNDILCGGKKTTTALNVLKVLKKSSNYSKKRN